MKIATLLLALFLAVGSAWGETLDELMQQLRTEVRAEIQAWKDQRNKTLAEAKDKDKAASRSAEFPGEVSRIQRLEATLIDLVIPDVDAGRSVSELTTIITRLRASSQSEKVEAIAKRIVEQATKTKADAEKALVERYAKTMRAAGEALLKSTKAAELDEPIRAISELRQETRVQRNSWEKLVDPNQLDSMRQLLIQWQNVLIDSGIPGRKRDAIMRLESLHGADLNDYVPRSTFLTRVASERAKTETPAVEKNNLAEFEKTVREILRGVKKVEDIPEAAEKVEAVLGQKRVPDDYSMISAQGILGSVRSIRLQYEELKNGFAPANFAVIGGGNSAGPELTAVRALLIQYGAPRILGLIGELAPTAEEQVSPYLRRVADHARKEKNWDLLRKVLEFAISLNVTAVGNLADVTSVRQMLAGLNMEKARQPAGAVAAYLRCLKTGSQVIPAEWIGEKLEKIKAASPKEYETGVQNAEKPEGVPASGNWGIEASGFTR